MQYSACIALACALCSSARTLTAQSAPRPTVAAVAGCYALTLGPWQDQYTKGAEPWQTVPAVIRLDSSLIGHVPGWRRLAPIPKYYTDWGRPLGSEWRLSPTDSVEAFWSTGFVSTALMLGVRGDTLIGKATASTDVRSGRPDPTATARAVRVTCPAELP